MRQAFFGISSSLCILRKYNHHDLHHSITLTLTVTAEIMTLQQQRCLQQVIIMGSNLIILINLNVRPTERFLSIFCCSAMLAVVEYIGADNDGCPGAGCVRTGSYY